MKKLELLEMNTEAINEITQIENNPTLNLQVLCLVQALSRGIEILVELITKNESLIIGRVWACTGHSFVIGSEKGVIADIRFSDIDLMEIKDQKAGA